MSDILPLINSRIVTNFCEIITNPCVISPLTFMTKLPCFILPLRFYSFQFCAAALNFKQWILWNSGWCCFYRIMWDPFAFIYNSPQTTFPRQARLDCSIRFYKPRVLLPLISAVFHYLYHTVFSQHRLMATICTSCSSKYLLQLKSVKIMWV